MATSGVFVVRIDPSLHRRLKAAAQKREISLNRLCAQLLGQSMSQAGANGRFGTQASIAVNAPLNADLIGKLRKEFGDAMYGVVLFGSVARGQALDNSDLDLLIVLAPGQSICRALYTRWETAISADPHVSPQFVSLPRSPSAAGGLWFEVALEGIVLWETRFVVSNFLRQVREQIAAGQIRRQSVDGHPYWVRNLKGAA